MSFSSKVKKELAGHISNATHCRIAEIAAIISMCGSVLIDVDEKYSIRVRTETDSTAEKFKTLVWKTFHIDAKIVVKKNAYSKNAETYTITIKDHNQASSKHNPVLPSDYLFYVSAQAHNMDLEEILHQIPNHNLPEHHA